LSEPQDDPFVGAHYVLSGYVRRGSVVPPPEAWGVPAKPQTFTVIMQNRPNDCRFAVAQIVRLRRNPDKRASTPLFLTDDVPSGPFIVWDLLDDQLVRGQRTGPNGLIAPPPPMWLVPTEDGALMKALMFYEHHP